MAVDLHTHSRYSDGSDHPTEIIGGAAAKGLTAVALTDHDILDGLDEAAAAAGEAQIDFVPGVELSVEWHGRGMHLLAYWVAEESPLAEHLEEIRRGRHRRNLEVVRALNDLGIEISIGEVEKEAGLGVVGRPHFAARLKAKGVVDTIGEAFDRYLATGRPAYRPRQRLEAAKAVGLAKESGAVAVVAHPHTLGDNRDEFTAVFPALAELGVDGVECHYVEYSADVRTNAVDMARRMGLIPSGGSDYHGTYKPGISIGVGKGDLEVPDSVLEELRSARPG